MLVEIDDETIDEILLNRINNDIETFSDVIKKMTEENESDGIFSYDFEEELEELKNMLSSVKMYRKWYSND